MQKIIPYSKKLSNLKKRFQNFFLEIFKKILFFVKKKVEQKIPRWAAL